LLVLLDHSITCCGR